MGFLENLGRRHFPPTEQLKRVPSRRLKIWVWFLPCAGVLPALVILLSGHVLVGLLLLVPGILLGGFIAWVRFWQVAPVIDERKQRPKQLPSSGKKVRPPTNVARRERTRKSRRRRNR